MRFLKDGYPPTSYLTLFKVFDLYLSYLNIEVLKEGYPPTSCLTLFKVFELHILIIILILPHNLNHNLTIYPVLLLG